MTQPDRDPSSPQPQPLPRSTVWFMAVSTGMIVANLYYIQPLLADIAREFHITSTQAGALAMVSQVGTALGMLFVIPLGDSGERRSLITRMVFAAAIVLLLAATARNALWLAIACFGIGVTGSTVHLFVPFAAHLAAPKDRGRVVGTVFSGVLMGVLLARTFAGIIGAHLGWRAVYVIASLMMVAVVVCVQFMLPRSEPTAKLSYPDLLSSTFQLARRHPALREAALIGATTFGTFSAFWTTLVFLLEHPPYHYGEQTAGLFGLVGVIGAAGAPAVGRLTDRRGGRFTVAFTLTFVLISWIVMGLAGKTLVGLIAGVLLLDFGLNSGHVANLTRIYSLDPHAKSRLNMFYMVNYFCGGALGSFFGAYAWRLYGWAGVSGLCVIVMALMLIKFQFFSAAASREPIAPHTPDDPISEF